MATFADVAADKGPFVDRAIALATTYVRAVAPTFEQCQPHRASALERTYGERISAACYGDGDDDEAKP